MVISSTSTVAISIQAVLPPLKASAAGLAALAGVAAKAGFAKASTQAARTHRGAHSKEERKLFRMKTSSGWVLSHQRPESDPIQYGEAFGSPKEQMKRKSNTFEIFLT
jgi:hypothetical protein